MSRRAPPARVVAQQETANRNADRCADLYLGHRQHLTGALMEASPAGASVCLPGAKPRTYAGVYAAGRG